MSVTAGEKCIRRCPARECDNGRTEWGRNYNAENDQNLQGIPRCNQNLLRRCGIWQSCTERPLHAIRKASTMRPGLHELTARQRSFMSKCTRCWLTNPRTRLERPQMATAMSRTFALCRNIVAAPDCTAFQRIYHIVGRLRFYSRRGRARKFFTSTLIVTETACVSFRTLCFPLIAFSCFLPTLADFPLLWIAWCWPDDQTVLAEQPRSSA